MIARSHVEASKKVAQEQQTQRQPSKPSFEIKRILGVAGVPAGVRFRNRESHERDVRGDASFHHSP